MYTFKKEYRDNYNNKPKTTIYTECYAESLTDLVEEFRTFLRACGFLEVTINEVLGEDN